MLSIGYGFREGIGDIKTSVILPVPLHEPLQMGIIIKAVRYYSNVSPLAILSLISWRKNSIIPSYCVTCLIGSKKVRTQRIEV